MEELRKCVEFYRSLGFSLIPICYGDKRPDWSVLPRDESGNPTWKPYQFRKPTDEEIQKWFFSGKERNIAVVLGSVSNNTFVIDLDSPELVTLVKSKVPRLFEETLVVESSRGVHLYFYGNIPVKSMKFQHSLGEIDIKGEGGYVLAPPSLHPSGKIYKFVNKTEPMKAYTEELTVEDFLRAFFQEVFPELLDELEHKLKGGVTARNTSQSTLRFPDVPPCLEILLQGVSEGMRNEACFLLSAYLTKLLPVEIVKDLMLVWNSKNSPPLSDAEVVRTVESASKYEISCEAIKRRISVDETLCDDCQYRSFMRPVSELYTVELEEVEMKMVPAPEDLQPFTFVPKLREGQLEAMRELLEADMDNIILKAPTGFGKTIVFLAKANAEAPALIVEPYRALQDQLGEKFGLFVVKGKANYPCIAHNVTADVAPCNYGGECDEKDKCPYRLAIESAKTILGNGGIVVTNHGNYKLFYNWARIIIFDEFHRILEETTNSIRLYSVSKNDLEVGSLDELIGKEIKALDEEISNAKSELERYEVGSMEYVTIAKRINRLKHKKEKLNFVFENIDYAFAYWKEITKKDGSKEAAVYVKLDEVIVFKRMLKWKKKKVFVSATPPEVKGVEGVKVIEARADFINKQNAPIIYLPIQKLTYWSIKRDEGKLKLVADFIKLFYGYLKHNEKTKKAIVHSGNIRLHGRKLAKFLQPYKVILHEKGKLDETLKKFKESDAHFLVVASGDVGFDFHGYDYTVQFIAKVPYPSWNEEWQARAKRFGKEETEKLYNKKAIDTILQICGRICRGGDDVGYTIILDSKFEDLFRDYYEFFDEGFRSRLIDLSPMKTLEKIMKEKGRVEIKIKNTKTNPQSTTSG